MVFNQIYFAVSVLWTCKNRSDEEKIIIFQSITMWAPYLVAAYLDFALCMQNISYNAGCLQGIDTWWVEV